VGNETRVEAKVPGGSLKGEAAIVLIVGGRDFPDLFFPRPFLQREVSIRRWNAG
jgi:hypothetical protein